LIDCRTLRSPPLSMLSFPAFSFSACRAIRYCSSRRLSSCSVLRILNRAERFSILSVAPQLVRSCRAVSASWPSRSCPTAVRGPWRAPGDWLLRVWLRPSPDCTWWLGLRRSLALPPCRLGLCRRLRAPCNRFRWQFLLFRAALRAGWVWALALRLFAGIKEGRVCARGRGFAPEPRAGCLLRGWNGRADGRSAAWFRPPTRTRWSLFTSTTAPSPPSSAASWSSHRGGAHLRRGAVAVSLAPFLPMCGFPRLSVAFWSPRASRSPRS